MSEHRGSYWKTIALVAVIVAALSVGFVLLIAVGVRAGVAWSGVQWVAWAIAAVAVLCGWSGALLVVIGGLICVWRDRCETLGRPYALPDSVRPVRPASG